MGQSRSLCRCTYLCRCREGRRHWQMEVRDCLKLVQTCFGFPSALARKVLFVRDSEIREWTKGQWLKVWTSTQASNMSSLTQEAKSDLSPHQCNPWTADLNVLARANHSWIFVCPPSSFSLKMWRDTLKSLYLQISHTAQFYSESPSTAFKHRTQKCNRKNALFDQHFIEVFYIPQVTKNKVRNTHSHFTATSAMEYGKVFRMLLNISFYGSQVTLLGFLLVEKYLEKETLCKSMKCQPMEFKSNLKPQLQ